MLSRINALILLLFFALSHTTFAIAEDLPYLDLGGDLFHLQPALQSNQASTHEPVSLAQAMASDQWVDLNGKTTLGRASEESWFRVRVPATVGNNNDLILEIGSILVNRVEFYLVVNNELKAHYTSGSDEKFSTRPIQHRKNLFPLPVVEKRSAQQQVRTVYLKVKSTARTSLSIRLWPREAFIQHEKVATLYVGVFLGAMLILGIYHLLLYLRIPKLYILLYSLATLSICCNHVIRWGFGLEYIWPESPLPAKPIFLLSTNLASAFFLLFFVHFTGVYRSNRSIRYYYFTLASFFLIGALASPFVKPVIMAFPLMLLVLIMHISNIFLALTQWRAGNNAGKYYLFAITPMLLGFTITILPLLGLAAPTTYTSYIGSASILVMACFIALAVAHKVRTKQEESALAIETLNRELEQKVIERTQSLNRSLETLKKTQQQLVESEKVAALTGLVCGVAHEINTPVGVGITATSSLKGHCDDMGSRFNNDDLSRADLENYIANSKDSLQLIENSFTRTAKLVSSFKSIAVNKTEAPTNNIKVRHDIKKAADLCSNLLQVKPPNIHINCSDTLTVISHPDLLSQLLLHLMNNSALHAFTNDQAGNIFITVNLLEKTKGMLQLDYRDDGKGIKEEDIDSIFNPFTTSSRGKGHAGLGTTAIHNIVTQGLQGTINCESPPGSGLSYHIEFPVEVISTSPSI